MPKTKKTIITIWVNPAILIKLDKFANKASISRSRLIHNMLEVGYDEIKLQNNIGIIKLTLSLDRLQANISKLLSGAKKKIVVVEPNQKGTNLSIRVDPELIKKVDALSNKLSMTRSIFIEYILEISIKQLKYVDIPVFIEGIILLRNLNETIGDAWKQSFRKSKKAIKEQKVVTELDENSD